MDLCLEKKSKKSEEQCHKPAKYIIRLENEKEYNHPRCGIHSKNIDNINKITYNDYKNKENNVNNKLNLESDFDRKININDPKIKEDINTEFNNKNEDNNKKMDKKERKKYCLSYLEYLRTGDDNDKCQFGKDCVFAHNFYIVYKDE